MGEFGEPEETGGLRLNPKDILNHLLLVWACDYIAHSPTVHSRPDRPSDVIIVDAVDLDQVNPDNGQPGLVGRRCWWRQAQLIQSLRNRIGGQTPMLVRMTKGVAKPGFAAPFQLVSVTADVPSVTRAKAWMAGNPGFIPSAAGPPPKPDHWDTQPPLTAQGGSAWSQPEQPNLPPPRPVTPAEETLLERMARSSVPGTQRQDQGPIPF